MDIKDINVFIGIDVGKMDHWATTLNRAGRKVPDKPLNRTRLCGGWFIWMRWWLVVVVPGVPDWRRDSRRLCARRGVSIPVDPLGGGERGRRRCPARGPGQRMSSALCSELSASARANPLQQMERCSAPRGAVRVSS